MRPRLLDLFCGAGGCSVGYHRAGFDVVGVDLNPQPNYPYEFIQNDVFEILNYHASWVERFDTIHTSPPCQAYTTLKARNRHIDHPELIAPVRELLIASGLPYVIENTPKAPLIDPITLCGSMFGLDVRRHRIFETNQPISAPPCNHAVQADKKYDVYEHGRWRKSAVVPVYGTGGGKAAEHWSEAMGIDWMTRKEMAEAIPPAYTEWIGRQLLAAI